MEVGRIDGVHGLRGELVVGFVTNMIAARTAPGSELFAGDRRLQVASARAHKNRWLVSFHGVDSRDDAEALRGRTLCAEPLSLDEVGGDGQAGDGDVVAFVHELIGRQLIDQHGTDHGPITAVVENPAADLLELADGRLVPLTFYRTHDAASVVCDVPVGLLDDMDEPDR